MAAQHKIMKTVLFDLDGTLVDRDASLRQFVTKQHQRFQATLGHVPCGTYVLRFIELDNRGAG